MNKTPGEIFRKILASQVPHSVVDEARYRMDMKLLSRILTYHGEFDLAELVGGRLKEHIARKEALKFE